MRLSITNRGADPLPFGLGFHLWILRTKQTLLQAGAKHVVFETGDHLPSSEAVVSSRPEWNFGEPRLLPTDWINNAFLGWDGRAVIHWRDRKLALRIEADPRLDVYIVYSPSLEADFFCFEPVTHPVDAHNAPGGPEANGLAVLAPQASLSGTCRLEPRHVG
jgi:aldose 1-epimerase